jgi:hypothetical protein
MKSQEELEELGWRFNLKERGEDIVCLVKNSKTHKDEMAFIRGDEEKALELAVYIVNKIITFDEI